MDIRSKEEQFAPITGTMASIAPKTDIVDSTASTSGTVDSTAEATNTVDSAAPTTDTVGSITNTNGLPVTERAAAQAIVTDFSGTPRQVVNTSESAPILGLPNELVDGILEHLHTPSRYALRQTCSDLLRFKPLSRYRSPRFTFVNRAAYLNWIDPENPMVQVKRSADLQYICAEFCFMCVICEEHEQYSWFDGQPALHICQECDALLAQRGNWKPQWRLIRQTNNTIPEAVSKAAPGLVCIREYIRPHPSPGATSHGRCIFDDPE